MTKHSKEEKLKAFSQLLDVVDTLKRRDDPAYDYSDDLAALLALWEEELAS